MYQAMQQGFAAAANGRSLTSARPFRGARRPLRLEVTVPGLILAEIT
jgi:hypothetical protein